MSHFTIYTIILITLLGVSLGARRLDKQKTALKEKYVELLKEHNQLLKDHRDLLKKAIKKIDSYNLLAEKYDHLLKVVKAKDEGRL